MAVPEGVREETLNVTLAQLLVEKGLKAIGEPIVRRKMPDVLIDLDGIRIIIEGKRIGHRDELCHKAQERIEEGLCEIVVMIEYVHLPLPNSLERFSIITQEHIRNAILNGKFNVGFMTFIDLMKITRWLSAKQACQPPFYEEVDFDDLIAHLLAIYDYVVREDALKPVIDKLESALNSFAQEILTCRINIKRLKRALELREGGEEDVSD